MVLINMPGERVTAPPAEWTEEDRKSVNELKDHLRHMREVMDDSEYAEIMASVSETAPAGKQRPRIRNKASVIDGSFMSFIFTFVFGLILCVSFYAFQNLYYAILKKFPKNTHTEL